ncbi:MAG: hypothetical protein ABR599_12995 [Gemmatimonadota bacterium]
MSPRWKAVLRVLLPSGIALALGWQLRQDGGAREAVAVLDVAARPGVSVSTDAERVLIAAALLEIRLRADRGFRIAKSPPNEIHLDLPPGVFARENPALLGEPFPGTAATEVRYYEGPATLRIPLGLAPEVGRRALVVSGRVVYRACDDERRVCTRHEQSWRQRIPAGA